MRFGETLLQVGGVLIVIQGLALSLLVASRRKNPGNIYLAFLLGLLAIHGLGLVSWVGPAPLFPPAAVALIGVEILLYGPLLWRYSWQAFNRGVKPRLPFAVHFIPALVVWAAYGLSFLILGPAEFNRTAAQAMAGGSPAWVKAVEAAKLVQGLSYGVAIVLLWYRNREGLRRWADRKSRIRWLRALAVTFLANWALAAAGNVLHWLHPSGSAITTLAVLVQAAAILAFLYVAAFFALRFPAILDPRDAREAIGRTLNLSEGFAEETLARLERARAAGAFADSDLDLRRLAGRLGLHPNALSFIVNDRLGMGFREYLNAARLDAFLEARKAGSPRSLLEDALDAGFASKTSFLRAFRARYGTTPSEYLERAGGGSAVSDAQGARPGSRFS